MMTIRERAIEALELSYLKPDHYGIRSTRLRLMTDLRRDYDHGIEVNTQRLLDLMAEQDREGLP